VLRRLYRWMTDPTPPEIKPDRMVEAAWLPLWQAQLVVGALWEADVPCAMAEDSTSHLRLACIQPMARIFVMEPRKAEAQALIEDFTGEQPTTLVR
jgi:hypothetical protein